MKQQVLPLLTAVFTLTSLIGQTRGPEVSYSAHADLSDPLYLIALRTPRQLPTAMKLGNNHPPVIQDNAEGVSYIRPPESRPTLIDRFRAGAAAPAIGASFDGLGAGLPGYSVRFAPPDTVMAVGPNHIFEWVNTDYAIFSKTGTPLLPAPGFLPGNSL